MKVATLENIYSTSLTIVPPTCPTAHSSEGIVNIRDHLQIIRSKSEIKRFFHFVRLQNPFHNLKRFIHYRNVSSCKRISVTKICFTLKLQKIALQIRYKTVL
jgi:glutaredoxin-related protein